MKNSERRVVETEEDICEKLKVKLQTVFEIEDKLRPVTEGIERTCFRCLFKLDQIELAFVHRA